MTQDATASNLPSDEAKDKISGRPDFMTVSEMPACGLLEYVACAGKNDKRTDSIVDLLRQDEGDFDFNPPRLGDDLVCPPDLD